MHAWLSIALIALAYAAVVGMEWRRGRRLERFEQSRRGKGKDEG